MQSVQQPWVDNENMGSLPPASVAVGLLVWLSAGVDSQEDTQDSTVGEVTQSLHGEGKHHLDVHMLCYHCTRTVVPL